MKPCEEYEVWISAFLDGELDGKDRAELMEHMAACRSCQRYFDDLVAIHDALDQEEAPVPEGFAEQVMARVRETEQEAPRRSISFPHWRQWTALAACCALAVLGLWSFRSARGDRIVQDAALASMPYAAQEAGIPAAQCEEYGAACESEEAPAEDAPKLRMADGEAPPQPEPKEAAKAGEDAPAPALAAAPPVRDNAVCTDYMEDALSEGTLYAGGETARRWVEEELGQTWESGRLYELTEEEYAGLLAALTEAEEDFRQESGEGFWFMSKEAGNQNEDRQMEDAE